MTRLDVRRMGDPILRQRARRVGVDEIMSPEMAALIEDMVETMHAEHGIGLAAPQIGHSIQLVVIDTGDEHRERTWICFNPQITPLAEETQTIWEGCLSVPGLRGPVARPRKIKIDYLNELAVAVTVVVEGLFATVCQHEMDHLQGILYLDRMTDMKQLSYEQEYEQFWMGTGEGELVD